MAADERLQQMYCPFTVPLLEMDCGEVDHHGWELVVGDHDHQRLVQPPRRQDGRLRPRLEAHAPGAAPRSTPPALRDEANEARARSLVSASVR